MTKSSYLDAPWPCVDATGTPPIPTRCREPHPTGELRVKPQHARFLAVGQFLIARVVSMDRRNAQLELTLH
jgi:hypothetical protein